MAKMLAASLVTLDHHITREEFKHPGATGEFTHLLHDLTFAIRIIARDVRRAGLSDVLGLTNETNVHGEQVKKLDVHANEMIIRAMERGGNLALMASEENEDVIEIPSKYPKGKYVMMFDPLDGSSNIDVNASIGTIFSFYKRLDETSREDATVEDLLQPGYKQVGAGYALYGSSTVLVYTTGQGVNIFTYDSTLGEFLLTSENIKMPKQGSHYSINEGNYHKWNKNFQEYIDYLKIPTDDKKHPYSHRYIGTGVADLHRLLFYGGIFVYPEDKKNLNGKLRICYEGNPLSMIIEQAGGKATNGKDRILNVKPQNIHQRTPLYIGSEDDVNECEMFLRGEHPYQTKKTKQKK